jgi:PAS domain S-box-containing protein
MSCSKKSSPPDVLGALTHQDVVSSKEFLQSILDGIGDSIKIVDENFRIIHANRASESRSGKEIPDMVGKACYSEFYNFDRPCAFCHTAKTFKHGTTEVAHFSIPGPGGPELYSELTSYPIKDEEGRVRYVIEITKDVTERKALERQLLHTERLASMGTLASSLAHEINNPLNVILGFAQDLLTETSADDPRTSSLKIIEQEALRCAGVLQRLLHFTRAHPPVMTQVDLSLVIEMAVALIRPQAKKTGVSTGVKISKDLQTIQGDPNQLEQLLVNLLLNSLQAMPQGGKLTVRADNDNGQVRITVTDTGEGIEPSDLAHVFEPFFSKKGVGGTGLGLPISQRIVTDHKGTIRLESDRGKGTSAILHFPPTPA